jgi:hypothetical protein
LTYLNIHCKVHYIKVRHIQEAIDQDPIAPSEPLFKQLGWMSIEQRIKYHKYLLVSKCLKNEAPVYLKNKIEQLSDRNGCTVS